MYKLLSLFHDVDHENRRTILDMVERGDKSKIIDFGCGGGKFTKRIARKVETDNIYGVEFFDEAVQLAQKANITVYRADLNGSLPIEDETFDFVHANQVIEHLSETDVFIKEIYRILKIGGYAIISTPNLASLHNIISLISGKQPFTAHISNEVILGNSLDPKHGMEHRNKGEIHLRIFTYSSLKELFEHHGFKIEVIKGVGYYPFPSIISRYISCIDKKHAVYLTMKIRKEDK